MTLIIRSGQRPSAPPLTSLELWREFAPPKSPETHWQDGRSAKELARAWTERPGSVPTEVLEALGTEEPGSPFHGLALTEAHAELVTLFPDGTAGARNHDLLAIGERGGERVLVDIEGKEREEFDKTLRRQWSQSAAANPRSNIRPRIVDWTLLISGRQIELPSGLPESMKRLHYQFFSGLAGTVLRAKQLACPMAVFLVHEFRHPAPDADLQSAYDANHEAIRAFLSWLKPSLADADISRPVRLVRAHEQTSSFDGIELFFAKATRILAQP